MKHPFAVSWSISCVRSLVRSLVGMFLPQFCLVNLETSIGLMPAAGELMMLNRLLIVPSVENAMLIIVANLCLLVLRPRGPMTRIYLSMVLQESRIMNSPEILWRTPPVYISGGRPWKAQSLASNLLFLLSGGLVVVWWWLLPNKLLSWALSLTGSSVVSYLHSFALFSSVWVLFFGFPNLSPHESWLIWGCCCVWRSSPVYKDGCGHYFF